MLPSQIARDEVEEAAWLAGLYPLHKSSQALFDRSYYYAIVADFHTSFSPPSPNQDIRFS